MKKCLIMGFGRSGTSLMAGMLFNAGYFLGDNLYPPRESNPTGFFENDLINGINESILEPFDYFQGIQSDDPVTLLNSPYKPEYGQRWLSYLPPGTSIINHTLEVEKKIQKSLSANNFAYKDPRFNYTLPVWKKFLSNDVQIICLIRQPEIVAESVLKDCQTADYLAHFFITRALVYELWRNSYSHFLKNLQGFDRSRVIFIHYEQLLLGRVIDLLSEILEVQLDPSFIIPSLNRSKSTGQIPEEVKSLYNKLCDFARF